MFDLNGRIGNWKFNKILLSPKLFEPLSGCRLGSPDRDSIAVIVEARRKRLNATPDGVAPSNVVPSNVIPSGWRRSTYNESFYFLLEKQIVAIQSDKLALLFRTSNDSTIYLRDSGWSRVWDGSCFKTIESAISFIEKHDCQIPTDLLASATESKPAETPKYQIPDGWTFESKGQRITGARVLVECRGGWSNQIFFTLAYRADDNPNHDFFLTTRGWVLGSSLICNFTTLAEAAGFAMAQDRELPDHFGLSRKGVEIPAGWKVERANDALLYNQKIILERVRTSGVVWQILYRKTSPNSNTVHFYLYLSGGWGTWPKEKDRFIIEHKSFDEAVAYVKQYDCEMPNA